MFYNYLVSVIVPVYNVENYLRDCLNSIIHQTYQNLDIILVDDGSTDNSGRICEEYAHKDRRVVVIHKLNEGVAQARIDGFNRSSGELVTFIDADDFVDLKYVEKLVEPFEQYDIDLSICSNCNYAKGKISYVKRSVHGLLDREQIDEIISSRYLFDRDLGHAGMTIFLWSKMIKREYVLDALLYAKGLWTGEDQVASFHILTHIKALYVIQEPLYFYVRRDGQATKIYNLSLWTNTFECWKRYRELDRQNLLHTQLPDRMWWTFRRIFRRMSNCKITFQHFKKDVNYLETQPIWREVLDNYELPQEKIDKLAFFLLKNKFYYIFYKILLKRL